MSSIRLGTSAGSWDPVPWPNFRCFLKKAKFISPTHCEKVDVASLIPQSLALDSLHLQHSQRLTSSAVSSSSRPIISSVSPSKLALSIDCHSICCIYSGLILYYYSSCSRNFPTSSDMNVAKISSWFFQVPVGWMWCIRYATKKERKRNSCLRIWKSFY